MTTKKITRRQAHWAEFQSRFNFVISYILGKDNAKIDTLIRQPNDSLSDDYDDCQQHLLPILILPKRLDISSMEVNHANTIFKKVI